MSYVRARRPAGRPAQAASVVAGMLAVLGGRAAARRAMLAIVRHAFAGIDRADTAPALRLYARDARLRQGEGRHRWADEHNGREAIARFLAAMVDARISLQAREVWFSGPPWALKAVVVFDERARDENGATVYANELACVLQLRGIKVVDHTDLVLSTAPLERLERHLRDRDQTDVSGPAVSRGA